MNLKSDDQRKSLYKQPDHAKLIMLENYLKSQSSEQANRLTPKEYIERLENSVRFCVRELVNFKTQENMTNEQLAELIESLRVSLTSNPVNWVRMFGARGLAALLDRMHDLSQ
jgi:hypothetical protein